MAENEQVLKELEKTIDQLIEISVTLKRNYGALITPEEMKSMREKQDGLIQQMQKVEQSFLQLSKMFSKGDIKRIDRKIKEFRKLNDEFLEKISRKV